MTQRVRETERLTYQKTTERTTMTERLQKDDDDD